MIDQASVKYAGFWIRLGAYLIDAILAGLVLFSLNYLNFVGPRSFMLYLLVTLLGMLYKPYFESNFGATPGKMATNLQVTSFELQGIDFPTAIIRNVFFILPSLMVIPIQYFAYSNPALQEVTGFWEYNTLVGAAYPVQGFLSCFSSILILTDIIVLLTDESKKSRSLHDRIAKTYVIYKPVST